MDSPPEDFSTFFIFDPMFHDGLSVGWHFSLPEVFAEALGFSKRKYVKNRDREKGDDVDFIELVSQGNVFDFHVGDLIYDSPAGRGEAWGEALRKFSCCVQVTMAVRGASGILEFSVYRAHPELGKVVFESRHLTTQSGFVRYLKTGKLPGE